MEKTTYDLVRECSWRGDEEKDCGGTVIAVGCKSPHLLACYLASLDAEEAEITMMRIKETSTYYVNTYTNEYGDFVDQFDTEVEDHDAQEWLETYINNVCDPYKVGEDVWWLGERYVIDRIALSRGKIILRPILNNGSPSKSPRKLVDLSAGTFTNPKILSDRGRCNLSASTFINPRILIPFYGYEDNHRYIRKDYKKLSVTFRDFKCSC